jgi:hypothetical protein
LHGYYPSMSSLVCILPSVSSLLCVSPTVSCVFHCLPLSLSLSVLLLSVSSTLSPLLTIFLCLLPYVLPFGSSSVSLLMCRALCLSPVSYCPSVLCPAVSKFYFPQRSICVLSLSLSHRPYFPSVHLLCSAALFLHFCLSPCVSLPLSSHLSPFSVS